MIKRLLLNLLRYIHLVCRKSELPDHIAVYFHELEPNQFDGFREGISYLVSRGYTSCAPSEYLASSGPQKRLFISFDDNFKDWHNALDMMDELGVKATFYVTSGVFHDRSTLEEQQTFMERINQPDVKQTLTVQELREISDRGHNIGCHTHTHPVLSQLPEENWEREIAHSKEVLERLINHEVTDFSFPFGMRRDFSPALEDYCRKIGFKSVATGISGQLYTQHPHPFQLHRTGWKFELPLAENIKNLKIDGRLYGTLFGRSVIG